MIFRQLFDRESCTYSYILGDEVTREALIIDPVKEHAGRDLQLLEELELKLVYVLETHIHADHITGAGLLRANTGARTVASNKAGVDCADIMVSGGDTIQFGSILLQVLETPGHTKESLSFFVQLKIFTGDALLIRGCGRTDFQGGDAGQLYHSIKNSFFNLPEETEIYPGHDYNGRLMSTVAEEKRHNPRLKLSLDEFIKHMNQLNLPEPEKMQASVPANKACGRTT